MDDVFSTTEQAGLHSSISPEMITYAANKSNKQCIILLVKQIIVNRHNLLIVFFFFLEVLHQHIYP